MGITYLPVFEEEEAVTAFFSTKEGASPKSPYYNQSVFEALALEKYKRIWPQQVHDAHIEVIKDGSEGIRDVLEYDQEIEGIRILKTDGLVTNVPEVLLTTVHADCLAVFFYDKIQKAIGVVHAGWRGTVKGISAKAVHTMVKEFGSKPSDILAYISPGISQCCFETGKEVYLEFAEKWQWIDDYAEKKGEKYYLNLKLINRRQLQELGVENIQISSHCTCCEPMLFCSYRGENGTTMRMGAGICLKNK